MTFKETLEKRESEHKIVQDKVVTCPYCNYKGKTHFYRRTHHCMKCNRLV